jgi:hypothetical protein
LVIQTAREQGKEISEKRTSDHMDTKKSIDHILKKRRSRIKISDFFVMLIPLCFFIPGIIMMLRSFKLDHAELLIPGIVFIIIATASMLFFLQKIKAENKYYTVITHRSKAENINISKEIIQELYGDSKVYGDIQVGILFLKIEAPYSKGKQITIFCLEKQVMVNYRDVKAPFSIFNRRKSLQRIIQAFERKTNKTSFSCVPKKKTS